MKLSMATLVFLFLAAPALTAQAPRRELAGKVFHLGENGEDVAEAGVAVSLEVSGAATITNDSGFFRLPIPSFFTAGEVLRLNVTKDGWRVRYPLDGELRVPAEPHKDLVRVELLPAGSKLFWTNDRIEKFVQDELQRTAAEVSHARGTREEFAARQEQSFRRSVRDWAERYGLSALEARAEIDRWVAEVQKNAGEDERRLGLAYFAQKEFVKAAGHFGLAAQVRAEQLERVKRERQALTAKEIELRRSAAHDFRLEGSAFYHDLHFHEAIAAYENALLFLDPAEDPREWAEIEDSLGVSLTELGTRAAGAEADGFLNQAVENLRSSLEARKRNQMWPEWASTQNNLGCALWAQATLMTTGEVSLLLLEEAIGAYRQALTVQTRQTLPRDWANTQSNLGLALKAVGIRSAGETSRRLLEEAESAYRNALEVRTRESFPQDWANTLSDLAAVYYWQGLHSLGRESIRLLIEALLTSRRAMEVITPESLPHRWASTQTRTAIYLLELALRSPEDPQAVLRESVAACEQALKVFTRTDSAQQWAWTEVNRAIALAELGSRIGGEQGDVMLGDALVLVRGSFQVYPREGTPARWSLVREAEGIVLALTGHTEQATQGFLDLTEEEPLHAEVQFRAIGNFQDYLFDAGTALDLARRWLDEHPEDDRIRLRSLGPLFASGLYTECAAESRNTGGPLADFLEAAVIREGYEIASLLARNQPETVVPHLQSLIERIAQQDEGFHTGYFFAGTLRHVRSSPGLANRQMLIELFEALDAPDRHGLLAGLQRVRVHLTTGGVSRNLEAILPLRRSGCRPR